MKGAAIDLGSNSFICYVFEFKNGVLHTLDDQIILTRLSEGVDQTKTLSEQALLRSEEAFKAFQKLFIKHDVFEVQAVATSAARDAKNQKVFLDLALKYRIPVRIITGDDEASLTFNGVKDNFKFQDGLIIDIGGGSTEFVLVQDGAMKDRISLDVGVVRFTERYIKNLDFKTSEVAIRESLKNEFNKSEKLNNFKNTNLEVFLAVSGTPTAAASIICGGFDPLKIDKMILDSDMLASIVQNYGYLKLDQRLKLHPYIETKRADVLPTGVLILDEALKFFNPKAGFKVSTQGIRHGLARFMCGLDVMVK